MRFEERVDAHTAALPKTHVGRQPAVHRRVRDTEIVVDGIAIPRTQNESKREQAHELTTSMCREHRQGFRSLPGVFRFPPRGGGVVERSSVEHIVRDTDEVANEAVKKMIDDENNHEMSMYDISAIF